MAEDLNCPNCGAPRDGPVCEYCGTRFVPREAILFHKIDKIDPSSIPVTAILSTGPVSYNSLRRICR